MLEAFKKFIEENELFAGSQRTLLAVSGGVDSMVMVDLFSRAGYEFAVAHCNFQLRGKASDEDELFVRGTAKQLGVPYFTKDFETLRIAEERKSNIQITARELRYEWLEQLRAIEHFDLIATAHHLDDAIETALLNWTKGCGIKGLQGIPLKNGKVIRPLLFATKEEIQHYSAVRQVTYREDTSNAEDKYDRNKIRHHVIPILKQLNPSLTRTMAKNFQRFQESAYWFDFGIEQLKNKIVQVNDHEVLIDTQQLKEYTHPATALYELLLPYGFNNTQTSQMVRHLDSLPGGLFHSPSYELSVDRGKFIIRPKTDDDAPQEHTISEKEQVVQLENERLSMVRKREIPKRFTDERSLALLDAAKLAFPLKLRHWQPGDYFFPLGMNGKRQKLQDFFTNQKVNRLEKHKIWIMQTALGEICWIVGYRIDDRFKISPNTQSYWRFLYSKN